MYTDTDTSDNKVTSDNKLILDKSSSPAIPKIGNNCYLSNLMHLKQVYTISIINLMRVFKYMYSIILKIASWHNDFFFNKILQTLKMLKLYAYNIVLQKRIFKYYLLFVYLVLGFSGILTKILDL